MSILIKGMEMPQGNSTINVLIYADGTVYTGHVNDSQYSAVSVPTPHGRLIDADKFEFEMNDKLLVALTEKYGEEEAQKGLHFSFRDCISNIQFQPTVIEAEGET